MKLNGLTNNLKDQDKTLSNSYLSHIVELLRQEVEALSKKEADTEDLLNEHIETQLHTVDTETVNADLVNAAKLITPNINDKIVFLTEAINVANSRLTVNGKEVLTEDAFTGPFTYRGEVEDLPVTADAGDVYIKDNTVYIYDGTDYDTFDMPVGSVSHTEFDNAVNSINGDIATLNENVTDIDTTLDNYMTETDGEISDITSAITDIQDTLPNKVDMNPIDDKAYVRKNDEWIEMSEADNTVKHTVQIDEETESVIDNSENGVSISSPKVEINSDNIKVNGEALPEVNKFGLSHSVDRPTSEYHYKLRFGRSPVNEMSSSAIAYASCLSPNYAWHEGFGHNPAKYTFFTKNYQYVKYNLSSQNGAANEHLVLTSLDKNGKVNVIENHYLDMVSTSTTYGLANCFFGFNPEYCPEEWQDTVYMFCSKVPYLLELKDGKFSRKIDMSTLVDQGFTPNEAMGAGARCAGFWGGKSLRSNTVKRICIMPWNMSSAGASYAIIIGGNADDPLDVFDPTKAIYVALPTTVEGAHLSLMATDTAWYIKESGNNRFIRISPSGALEEFACTNMTTGATAPNSYLEYTDSNGRPACAQYVANTASGAQARVVFIEEAENGAFSFYEKLLGIQGPTGTLRPVSMFRFVENDHMIFFTLDCGISNGLESNNSAEWGTAAMKNKVWYIEKSRISQNSSINYDQIYTNLTFEAHSFIELHKTKDNVIWAVPYIQGLTAASRTGTLIYYKNAEYLDRATVNIGTNHAFFTFDSGGYPNVYTHPLDGGSKPTWDVPLQRSQFSAVNDDGVLCIIAADLKAYALCYGNGNFKVYECSSDGAIANKYACDADKESIIPDFWTYGNSSPAGQSACLLPMKHGWLLNVLDVAAIANGSSLLLPRNSVTYIGLQYVDDEPSILIQPEYTKIPYMWNTTIPQMMKYDKFGYMMTYDYYERRKYVLSGIKTPITYYPYSSGGYNIGYDAFIKEEREGSEDKINLTYNGDVIASTNY